MTFVTRISLTTLQATDMGFFGLYGSTAAPSTTLTLATVINGTGIGFQRGTHSRLAVMLYIRFPLSLLNVEDLLHERGIDTCHETVRFWWHRFGPMFAAEIRKRRTRTLQKFASVHTSVHNHFNQERASPPGPSSRPTASPLSLSGAASARPEARRVWPNRDEFAFV